MVTLKEATLVALDMCGFIELNQGEDEFFSDDDANVAKGLILSYLSAINGKEQKAMRKALRKMEAE
ncbi:MAG: hypothetical protein K8E24_012270 [Methanobacterium paludis]|nr:hypothetical protein [Methanobacterium paludis]